MSSGDYGSEFEYDSEEEKKRQKRRDLAEPSKNVKTKLPSKRTVGDEYDKEVGKITRMKVLSLDAFSRHKKLINDYLIYYGGNRSEFKRDTSRDKTDMDIVRENHRFLWDEDDDADDTCQVKDKSKDEKPKQEEGQRQQPPQQKGAAAGPRQGQVAKYFKAKKREKRMAKKYYDKLFKEYCICDLSRYKENKVAMRWRIEKELVEGKGQFNCGEKRCKACEGLRSWEVNFAYQEHGERKNALVKLRLCPDCSYKLNYRSKKREVTLKRKHERSEDKEEHSVPKKHKDEHEEVKADEGESSSRTSDGSTAETSRDKSSVEGTEEENLWAGPAKITEDKSREEEFDDYFEDMFL